MRRRPASVVAVAAVALLAAACGGKDGATGQVDAQVPTVDLTHAVTLAQAAMPLSLPNSRVRVLLGDLCAAGPGDASGIVQQIAGMPIADQAQAKAVVAALDAGTADACPDAVDPKVHDQVAAGALAAAPSPTTTVPAAAAAGTSGSGSSSAGSTPTPSAASRTSSTVAATGSSGSSGGGASNSSNGAGVVGSGNANGAGNRSDTNFGQDVTATTG